MRSKRILSALLFTAVAFAGLLLMFSLPEAQAQDGDVITLNYNLQTEPPTLDPAKATDSTSFFVMEQLFIGLVDVDDETGDVAPELATNWDVSADGTVYTFTLRSDVTWSNGDSVTAEDVRYGILRTLDPATEAGYTRFLLYDIVNAEAYNTGQITDPGEVGVETLDDTHLRITLAQPASRFLSILGMPMARPLPQWAIEAHGDAWTEPGNIVTNGPYRLTEWVHDDHILLDKNPTYYAAANVQIERVRIWMVSDIATAFQMYLGGQLDTTWVPSEEVSRVRADPLLGAELYVYSRPCTYYYGFSVAQPPFDNPLVRKAFVAAVNRQGLSDSVLGGGPLPALTYTPPGIFGHVDGYAEGVGMPYDPDQAQQWLTDAGYPNGEGLPGTTLWFNESAGHQAIAGYIRQNWIDNLGVTVTLQSLPWGDYVGRLGSGDFQIWRMGWCADYNDAYNFLNDGIKRDAMGNWHNATYDSLLAQAAQEQDSDTRKALYKQAEEILVETDAVMMPLYYYVAATLTKPYLQRTYPSFGAPDISTWRLLGASGLITPEEGGTLASPGNRVIVSAEAGVVTDTVLLTYMPQVPTPTGSLVGIGQFWTLTAVYTATSEPAQPIPGATYTITVHYTDIERGTAIESTLGLYWWDGNIWSQEGITSTVDATNNVVTAQVNRFSLFAVLGQTRRVFLPLVLRND